MDNEEGKGLQNEWEVNERRRLSRGLGEAPILNFPDRKWAWSATISLKFAHAGIAEMMRSFTN